MLSVGRWQPETRERFPVFRTPLGQGGGRVFFGRPRLRQRDVAGPMYRGCMERWNALIDHVCRRRQLNREVVENLMCQARLAKARPSARSWGRKTPIVNVGRISPIAEGESGSRFVFVTGGLYNFPADFLGRCPAPFLGFAEPGFDGCTYSQPPASPTRLPRGGNAELFTVEAFSKTAFAGQLGETHMFCQKNLPGATLWGLHRIPSNTKSGGERGSVW